MKAIEKDDILVFTGYTDPSIPEEDKLLTVGQRIKVWEIDASGAIAVLPALEDGTFDETSGDTVYDGEYQTLEDYEAATAQGDAATDTSTDTTTAAEVAPAAGKGKGKAKAAKTEAKPKTEAKATTKATVKADAKAATKAKTETKAKATIQPVAKPEIVHSASVQEVLSEHTDALEAAAYLVEKAAENDYTLGGVLAHIKREGIHERLGFEGKKGFEEYTEKTLGLYYRKAMYLISIYEHYRTLDIPEERLAEIGWSKAKELTNITDRAAFDAAHEFAKDHTRDELQAYLKTTVNGDAGGNNTATTVTKVTRSFKLFEDQATTVDRALTAAKAQSGSEDENVALEHICAEWSMMQENNSFTVEDYIALINARFNVDLVVAPAEDAPAEEQALELEDETA